MKIRTDFVSNSSSSSFCVKNTKKAITLLNDLGEIPYQIESEIRFTITCYYKDVNCIYEEILHDKYKEYGNYYDFKNKRDPNDIEYIYEVDLYKLKDAVESNNKALSKILSLSIVSDNTLSTAVLYLLFCYFKKKNLKPDDSDTEIHFNIKDNFLIKLVDLVTKKSKRKKNV